SLHRPPACLLPERFSFGTRQGSPAAGVPSRTSDVLHRGFACWTRKGTDRFALSGGDGGSLRALLRRSRVRSSSPPRARRLDRRGHLPPVAPSLGLEGPSVPPLLLRQRASRPLFRASRADQLHAPLGCRLLGLDAVMDLPLDSLPAERVAAARGTVEP